VDQFGVVDGSLENLFLVAKIRLALALTPVRKCIIKDGGIKFIVKKDVKIKPGVLLKKLEIFSSGVGGEHRFEGGLSGETNIFFENIRDDNLLKTVRGFAGLFSGGVVD
jgi:hypothetical protein